MRALFPLLPTSNVFRTLILVLSISFGSVLYGEAPSPSPSQKHDSEHHALLSEKEKARQDARMAWFREAKFGMFITWGLYSVPAGVWKGKPLTKNPYAEWIEWSLPIPHSEYAAIATTWIPKNFDADAWVKTAKEAGMKYLLITAKFHDGFLMYPSKITKYNIHDCTPWKHDPVKELSEACVRQGLKFGVYWNEAYDWQNPDAITPDPKASANRNLDKYIDQVALPQLKELLIDHPLISFIWFDQARATPEMTYERGKKFADLIRSIRPEIIFNSRLGSYPADYDSMGDNRIPGGASPHGDWESPCTMNRTWGYSTQDTTFKSAETLLRDLIDVVSKGGNFLLNVGPTGDGVIPSPEIERLQVMGSWLRVNGEAIYGSTPAPFGEEMGTYSPIKKDKKGNPLFIVDWKWRATSKPGHLYLILFQWPDHGSFTIPAVAKKITKASLLASPSTKLTVSQSGKGVIIGSLPQKAPDPIASVIDVRYELEK